MLPWVGCLGLGAEFQLVSATNPGYLSGVTVQSRHHKKDSLRDEFSKQTLQVWKLQQLQYPYGVHSHYSLVNFRQSNSLQSTRQLLTIFVHWSRQVTASVYNMHPQTLVTRLHGYPHNAQHVDRLQVLQLFSFKRWLVMTWHLNWFHYQ